MNLYPLKFAPILQSKIWGGERICKFKEIESSKNDIGESWEISGVKDYTSVVSNGDLTGKQLDKILSTAKEKLVGKKNYERFGNTFPLLIKFIDSRDDLSIQVHPDDVLGKARHNSMGKTEMWYVIDALEGSCLYSGFSKKLDADQYEQSIDDNTFMDYLTKHEINKGDVFFLPAGRVHAIGAGAFIAEIQQTSDITYRIYDYNRTDAAGNKRELHTELAKDAINFNDLDGGLIEYTAQENEKVELKSCEYFTTNLLEITTEKNFDYKNLDSFVIYICTEGKAEITDNNNNTISVKQGESILIPATVENIKIKPEGNVNLLEAYI